MKQKTRFKNFGNIGCRYQPQRSHIGQSLIFSLIFLKIDAVSCSFLLWFSYFSTESGDLVDTGLV